MGQVWTLLHAGFDTGDLLDFCASLASWRHAHDESNRSKTRHGHDSAHGFGQGQEGECMGVTGQGSGARLRAGPHSPSPN